MRTKEINLLIRTFDYTKAEKKFQLFRRITFAFCILNLVIVVGSFATLTLLSRRIDTLTKEKALLEQATSQKINREEELNYVVKKVALLDTFLKDDARSLPYYNLLASALGDSTQSARLASFDIQYDRSVNFELEFSNLEEMLNSFKFIESDAFLKNFETLTLSNFSSTSSNTDASNVKSFTLSLNGRFIPIPQAQN